MARRKTALAGPSLLDRWKDTGNILEPMKRPKEATACACRPVEQGHHGGQRPMLRWRDHQSLMAYCGICQRELIGGINRRRAAVHAIGLSQMPPGHLDLNDLVAAGLMLPEHLEPPADPWAIRLDSTPVLRAMATAGNRLEPQ